MEYSEEKEEVEPDENGVTKTEEQKDEKLVVGAKQEQIEAKQDKEEVEAPVKTRAVPMRFEQLEKKKGRLVMRGYRNAE